MSVVVWKLAVLRYPPLGRSFFHGLKIGQISRIRPICLIFFEKDGFSKKPTIEKAPSNQSRAKVEEAEFGEGGEIRVEGDDAGAAGTGERRDPGIGPEMGREIRAAAPKFKPFFGGEGVFDKTNLGQRGKSVIGVPRFDGGERSSVHHAGVGEQAEQAKHSHAAEGDVSDSLLFPIAAGVGVVGMVGVNKGQSEVAIGNVKLRHGHPRRRAGR